MSLNSEGAFTPRVCKFLKCTFLTEGKKCGKDIDELYGGDHQPTYCKNHEVSDRDMVKILRKQLDDVIDKALDSVNHLSIYPCNFCNYGMVVYRDCDYAMLYVCDDCDDNGIQHVSREHS